MLLSIGKFLFRCLTNVASLITFSVIMTNVWNTIVVQHQPGMPSTNWRVVVSFVLMASLVRGYMVLPQEIFYIDKKTSEKKFNRELSAVLMLTVFCPIVYVITLCWSLLLNQ